MQSIFLSLLWKILPLALGALGKLIVDLVPKAMAFVKSAADNKTLPNGVARHEFVANEVLPTVKDSGVKLIDSLQPALAGVITEIAYVAVTGLKK